MLFSFRKAICYVMCLLVMIGASPMMATAYVPSDYTVMLSASVQTQLPKITLTWNNNTSNTGGYSIFRKGRNDSTWGTAVAQLPVGSTSYTDTNVLIYSTYEYKVKMNGGTGASGYIYTGIDTPAMDFQGKVVLIVENTYLSKLADKINRLVQDLTCDGWIVLRHDVSQTDTPATVKALIQEDYNADPQNVKSVFLLGHVPVYLSGAMNPDGHETRPFPADVYYGDMDGVWNDTTPPTTLPSDVELQVGRVDMWNLPIFEPLTEEDLLARYLDKDHAYRMGLLNLQRRGFVHDDFGVFGMEAFARNGWGNFPQLTGGYTNVQSGVWKDTLLSNDYLFSYIDGGGTYISISTNALTSTDLVTNSYKTNFAFMFGSYFVQWNTQNNLMRSFLAMPNYGLTNAWGARPNWFIHHMGQGYPIGYSAKLSQNNNSQYDWSGLSPRGVHTALLGDPTLRLYPISPPESATLLRSAANGNTISWESSPQSVLGYYVYRAEKEGSNYENITPDMLTGNMFIDKNPTSSGNVYMVRAVNLENGGSGTYYNLSQGTMAQDEKTDSLYAFYDALNERIEIRGYASIGEGKEITIKLLNPDGEVVHLNQLISEASGSFSISRGVKNIRSGMYTACMGHVGIASPVTTTFEIFTPLLVKAADFTFFNDDMQPLDALVANANVTVQASVSNQDIVTAEATMIISQYSVDNTLQKISIHKGDISAKSSKTMQANLQLTSNVQDCFLKVFVWNNLSQLQSLSGTIQFP